MQYSIIIIVGFIIVANYEEKHIFLFSLSFGYAQYGVTAFESKECDEKESNKKKTKI